MRNLAEMTFEVRRRGLPQTAKTTSEVSSLLSGALNSFLADLDNAERTNTFALANRWLWDAFYALQPSRRPRDEVQCLDLLHFVLEHAVEVNREDYEARSMDDADGRYRIAVRKRLEDLGRTVAPQWWFGAGRNAVQARRRVVDCANNEPSTQPDRKHQ